ncbi:BACON domain-containing protein [Catenulispora subtropica]|uniref:BACON domain-containing protein n=1 Tax=Catenulispora subtropica TaxID=450798 RepID=A0ABP5E6K7_9ACTN
MKDHDSNASDPLDPADPVNRDSVSDSWGRAAAYDAYADGLHTYALGGLRNHEAAASAVYCTFVAADHHVAHLGDAEMLRPWLYAIARHYCRAGKLPRMRLAAASGAASPGKDGDAGKERSMAELERSLLAAELSSLDWPDTDGLTAAHREVLELSVRHGMESRAVGLILGKPAAESFELLSAAWHELERSLAATALLRTTREHCPDLAALADGWSGRLTAQRREPLVAHVDACSRCQFHLHRVVGAPQAPSILPHVPAPKGLRERVLSDLLDTGPEKEAEKAAIAGRLIRFDTLGFPTAEAMYPPRPRQAAVLAPSEAEKKPRLLGALLTGRTSSAAAEAAAGAVASAPGRLATVRREESRDHDGAGLTGRTPGRRAAEAAGDGPIAPRRGLAAAPVNPRDEALVGAGPVGAVGPVAAVGPVGPVRPAGADPALPRRDEADTTVMPLVAGGDGVRERGNVFEDLRADRAVSTTAPPPSRNSVAAAVEGRRRGAADVKKGVLGPRRRVRDTYEVAATVAAAMAAEDPSAHQAPRIVPARSAGAGPGPARPDATRVFARPAPVPTRRKSTFRSALASSAVLSGAGAAGVTAFVLFVPSTASSNKTLFTPPDPNGNSAQVPDYPRPSSGGAAGPALPVAGGLRASGSERGGDTVSAQVVAAVMPAAPSSTGSAPGSSAPPFGGPMDSLPSAVDSTGPGPGPSTGTGQLNISVTQRSNTPGEVTVTLWNSGTAPVSWTASPDAPWLRLSAVSGILAPGAQTTMRITVDHAAEPSTAWQAHVRFDPSGQMVALSGSGNPGTPSSPPSTPSSTPSTPSTSGSSSTPSTPGSSSTTPGGSTSPSSPPSTPGPPPSTPTTPHSSPASSASSPGGPATSGSSSNAPSSPPSTNPSGTNPSGTNPSGTDPSGTSPSGASPSGTGAQSTPSQPPTPRTDTRPVPHRHR